MCVHVHCGVCACACGMFMLNVLCACIQIKHNKSIKSITSNIQIQCNQCFARCWLARLFLFILLSVTLMLHMINQTINRCKHLLQLWLQVVCTMQVHVLQDADLQICVFCFDHVQFFDSVYGSLCVQMHVYAIHASACAVLLPLYNCL